jgi:hypothetical protein
VTLLGPKAVNRWLASRPSRVAVAVDSPISSLAARRPRFPGCFLEAGPTFRRRT